MEMIDVESKEVWVEVSNNNAAIRTWRNFRGEGFYCQISGDGFDATTHGNTRGEAMLELGIFLKKLGLELTKQAFLQEGAVDLRGL